MRDARATAPPDSVSANGSVSPQPAGYFAGEDHPDYHLPHFDALVVACEIDQQTMSFGLRVRTAGYARKLAVAGYTPEQILLAGERWATQFPNRTDVTAPRPNQLADNIRRLLNIRETNDNQPRTREGQRASEYLAAVRAGTE